jgi:hypothetical protein
MSSGPPSGTFRRLWFMIALTLLAPLTSQYPSGPGDASVTELSLASPTRNSKAKAAIAELFEPGESLAGAFM